MKVADEGVSLFYKLVSKLYNNSPILPVKPELLFSTEDTVNYIYDGLDNDKDESRLVASKSIAKSGTRSRYTIDESKHMCCIRVKLTYTFSAAGTTTPIFISILGLTERELNQDSCISLKIKGIRVGGGWVTVGSSQEGMILLIRGDVGYDKIRYKIYRDQVFLPFVAIIRSEYGDGRKVHQHLIVYKELVGKMVIILKLL